MRKIFGYRLLGQMLQGLADACFKADEQQRNGEKVTACGMTDEEIETLCEDYLPHLLNAEMPTEEVRRRLGVSEATLNRMVERGDLPRGRQKVGGHTRWWMKWDVLAALRRRRGGKTDGQ